MSANADPSASFTSREPEIAYRPISQMAVFCLVLAVLSFLAFASMIFWPLPLIALGLSIWTSRRLEAARREIAGQFVVKLALFLSLIGGLGAVTQYSVQRVILTRAARHYANGFLDAVLQNRVKEAFVMTRAPLSRAGMEDDVDQLLERTPDEYRTYLQEDPVVSRFTARLPDAQVSYLGSSNFGQAGGFFHVVLTYEVLLEEKAYEVKLVLQGAAAPGGEWEGRQWYVASSSVKDRSNE